VVSRQDIGVTGIAVSIIVALWFFLNRTRQGLAMRAVAQDMVGADIVGINRNRIFSITFAIASVLVGAGGILLAPKYFVSPLGGWEILVKAWVVTAFGGMGSLLGAVYAAFILGIVEAFVAWQLGLTYTLLVWFAILIGLFIIRPQGLKGTWG
jgi:branched-chain amino acid transport system permease protein